MKLSEMTAVYNLVVIGAGYVQSSGRMGHSRPTLCEDQPFGGVLVL
jgi:hypothetical protein